MRLSLPVSLLMASAPALLMGVVALTARIEQMEHLFPEYGPRLHRDILAYVDLVKKTDSLYALEGEHKTAATENLVSEWQHGYQTGSLRPIPPAEKGDLGEEGPRYEIAKSKGFLLREATTQVEALRRRGDLKRAAALLSATLKLAQSQRYASHRTASESAKTQLKLVRLAAGMAPSLDTGDRGLLAATVALAPSRPGEFQTAWSRVEFLDGGMRAAGPDRFGRLVNRSKSERASKQNNLATPDWWTVQTLKDEALLDEAVTVCLTALSEPKGLTSP
jgi:hypothetical protein